MKDHLATCTLFLGTATPADGLEDDGPVGVLIQPTRRRC